jgi:hypothetical protein
VKRAILSALVVGTIGLTVAACSPHEMRGNPHPSVTAGLKPCPVEDDPGPCFWDAKHRGNGHGRSFIVINDVVTYQ